MEIVPPPPRRLLSTRARVLLLLGIFAPVTVLALVPTMFGLQRYVVTSDTTGGGIERGSVVFERRVPVSDLRVGDVITFPAPRAEPGDPEDGSDLVTRRIERIDGTRVQTQEDARAGTALRVVPRAPTMLRVVVSVPFVGYPFIAPIGQSVWLLFLLVPGVLLAAVLVRDAPRGRAGRVRAPHRVRPSSR